MGDVKYAGKELISVAERGTVLKDVTVYRAYKGKVWRPNSVTSWTIRKDWAQQYAKDNDLELGEYYPSKSTMIEFFWGHYLDKFSEEKGYPLRHKPDNRLRYLIVGGIKSFERGDLLKWKV